MKLPTDEEMKNIQQERPAAYKRVILAAKILIILAVLGLIYFIYYIFA